MKYIELSRRWSGRQVPDDIALNNNEEQQMIYLRNNIDMPSEYYNNYDYEPATLTDLEHSLLSSDTPAQIMIADMPTMLAFWQVAYPPPEVSGWPVEFNPGDIVYVIRHRHRWVQVTHGLADWEIIKVTLREQTKQ